VDCPVCHTPLPETARFCLSCGGSVRPPSEASADPLRESLEAAIGFQYRVERLLGRGGMGAVYLAHELALDRPVAIKVLPPDRSDPAMRERFKREARTAARLTHSGIVPLHTFGEVKGLLYFVMGYVDGESLAARLAREGNLDPEEARRILVEVAEALEYAHRQGVVHRDVKPDNVLIEGDGGRVVLADFGIARAAQAGASLTDTGHVVGTPQYMSPEQASGRRDVDGRSDLYSLGVMGYAMLSGRPPFEGTTPAEVLVKHLTQEPPALQEAAPGAPEQLVSAVTRCLAKDPATRWTDAGSLKRALVASQSEAPEQENEVSVLRIGILCLVAALPVRAYTVLFQAAAPDWDAVMGVEAARALGALGAFLVAVAVLALGHGKKMPWRAMLAAALQQPGWWGTWYPRAFRRRGDVWHRLPRRIRRFNTAVGLTAIVFLFVSMPLPILLVSAQGFEARMGQPSSLGAQLEKVTASRAGEIVLGALFFLPFVALVVLTAEALLYGRHLVRTLGPSLSDPRLAAQALHIPSWKRGFWDKPPFDSLLLPEEHALSRGATGRRPRPSPGIPGSEPDTMTRPANPPRVD
jgi:predicted Ser/Thr protein kinase